MSYSEQFVLAEEIGREVARNISVPSQPEVIVKTEETRPTISHIINHNLHNANQWYEVKLSKNLRSWQLRVRGNHELSYSFSPTHQTYMTLSAGNVLSEDTSPNVNINAIYVMSTEGDVVCELECWD